MANFGRRLWRLWQTARAVGRRTGWAAAVLVAIGVGYLLHWGLSPAAPELAAPSAAKDPAAQTIREWTCSMHPEVRKSQPGPCPKCGMELIPVVASHEEPGSLRELRITPDAAALMHLDVAPVERKFVSTEIRLVGKIAYDETRLAFITAWVAGRLDRLYVDYTGVTVRKGDHMVSIYSPQLLSAQEELIQSLAAVKNLKPQDVGLVRQTAEATVAATRDKLRLLGLKPEQIERIEKTGKAEDHITLYSPASGIVVHKNAQEGMYVTTGTRIYTVADLWQVWVKLDAYESDLDWLRPGQEVEFTTVAYPGQTFRGRISFIDPVLNDQTRTVDVRITAKNADSRLKPGMFVKAVVRADLAAQGSAMAADLAGKWICPHHPDVIEDAPGECSKCGWPLQKAESLYHIVDAAKMPPPLVIPAAAVLMTGTRAIVYVQVDPSLLDLPSVADWPRLILSLRQALSSRAQTQGEFLNTRCPIMGTKLDLSNVPANLTRPYQGGKVAFCCPGCPDQWDKLSEAQKESHLAGAVQGRAPAALFWQRISEGLRADLLATGPDYRPPLPLRYRFIREANAALKSPDFHDPQAWKGVTLTPEAQGLLQVGPANLPPMDLTRLNRLLLESIFPEAVTAATTAPLFDGREIVLGPRAGDYYVVRSGLAEGDLVVTRGNFKIDAELQIQAKPSMMMPDGGGAGGGMHHHGGTPAGAGGKMPTSAPAMVLPPAVQHQLHGVLAAADDVRKILAGEDLAAVHSAFAALQKAIQAVQGDQLEGHPHLMWAQYGMRLKNDAVEGQLDRTLEDARRTGESLSRNVAAMRTAFGLSHDHAAAQAMPATAPATRPTTQPATVWTCPMHPQVRKSGPGKCPLCGMDLVQRTQPEGGHSHE